MNYKDIPKFPRAYYTVSMPWNYVESNIEEWQNDYSLNLNPDFQREHVWTPEQQVRYIEYCLQGGEVGKVITFNCPGWMRSNPGEIQLLDGKQRIEAVRSFFRDETQPFGYKYSEIEGRFPWGDVMFIWQICRLETRAEVLQLYLNINAGGTPHTSEELDRVRALLNKENHNAK